MNCRTARMTMVAARDGELAARQRRALDRHLDGCATCGADRVALEGVLGALETLPLETEVPARLEQQVMRRVRAVADEEPAWNPRSWTRFVTPAVAATAVVTLAVVGLRPSTEAPVQASKAVAVAAPQRVAEAPTTVARRTKTRAPSEPPAALASRPDLFMDLPMLREFDKIRHYDAIAGMDDDTDPG